MIDKQKVRELAKFIFANNTKLSVEDSIAEWLEQNLPEPVVVGLSDKQVLDLSEIIFDETGCGITHVIEKWQKTQTFAQTEVKEVTSKNVAESKAVEEEVVERSPQQFKPNWADAPEWANWLAQDENANWTWYETEPKVGMGYFATNDRCDNIKLKNPNWKQSLQHRPKPPVTSIEVGQVWTPILQLNGLDFEIISIVECIECKTSGGFIWRGAREDFLTNFKRVS